MAFSAVDSTSEPRSWSEGPLKYQVLTYSAISGDTSGTITADRLTSIAHIFMDGGLTFSSAPSFSGNVATIAFNDPAASVYGTILVAGK
jgi:hypothetical protein